MLLSPSPLQHRQPTPPLRLLASLQSKHADVEMGQEEALLPLHLDAIRCWYRANDDMRAAIKAFLQPDPSRVLLNSSRFIATSVKRLEGHYSLRKEPAKGQPNKVPDETAKKALEILWAGFEAEGKRVYWDSIEDACEESPGLKAIKEQCGCCPRTLLRAMRRVERECRRRVERAVRPFTPENKRARQDACKFLLKCPVNYLRRIFWLDAATIYVVPKNMTVYAPPCARLVVSDPRLAGHSLVRRKLKFYILVNAIAGPVALEFVTGTTDLEAEEVWLVSTALYACAVPVAAWVGRKGAVRVRDLSPCCSQGKRRSKTQSHCLAASAPAGLLPAHAGPSWLHPGGVGATAARLLPARCGPTGDPAHAAPPVAAQSQCCSPRAVPHLFPAECNGPPALHQWVFGPIAALCIVAQ